MPGLERATEIAEERERSAKWRSKGEIATAVMAAAVAAVPIVGGPASIAIDKIGAKITSAGIEAKFAELCHLVAGLEPALAKVQVLEDRIAAVLAVVAANSELAMRLDALVSSLGDQPADQTFWVESLGGSQTFSNVTVRDMLVLAEAHSGAVNYFKNVKTTGPGVHFKSTSGGSQHVENSTFEGDKGSIGMNGISIEGPISIEGGGTSITFRGNSSLTFGSPHRKKP